VEEANAKVLDSVENVVKQKNNSPNTVLIKMKIAITSTGNSLESELDPRFGRCAYFIIYDTETKEHDIIRNENKNIDDGAGPKAVELIASHQVKKVISKEFGIKIKSLLCDYKIQMIMIKEKRTIEEIIKLINH